MPSTPLWGYLKAHSLEIGANLLRQTLSTSKDWKGWVVGTESMENWVDGMLISDNKVIPSNRLINLLIITIMI